MNALAIVFVGSFAILSVIFEYGARSPSHDARDQLPDADRALLDVLNHVKGIRHD